MNNEENITDNNQKKDYNPQQFDTIGQSESLKCLKN